jgi:hypothetical protein
MGTYETKAIESSTQNTQVNDTRIRHVNNEQKNSNTTDTNKNSVNEERPRNKMDSLL